ncbi:hypothetical protein LCGC14_2089230, partial [marine sediment metagenome]
YVYEDIQFNTYDNSELGGNKLVEIRQYRDNFIDQHSIYDINDKVRTGSESDEQGEITYTGETKLTIDNIEHDTELSIRSEGVTLFTVMNVSEINWDIPTWGPDNVPIRFDTLTTGTNIIKEYIGVVDAALGNEDDLPFRYLSGSSTTESLFEKTITISIANRYSLYHDYLKNEDSIYDLTEFTVKGIFITPKDGEVYYSSQKKDYEDGNIVKKSGHYLLYDSDENEFYETVFILAPLDNGVYRVISIGYNYDGLHDFVPYINPEQTFERINDATSTITRYNTYDGAEWDNSEDYSNFWNDEMLNEINTVYNSNPSDGWIVKDQIIEIEKIAKGVDDPNRYTELYRDVEKHMPIGIMNLIQFIGKQFGMK